MAYPALTRAALRSAPTGGFAKVDCGGHADSAHTEAQPPTAPLHPDENRRLPDWP